MLETIEEKLAARRKGTDHRFGTFEVREHGTPTTAILYRESIVIPRSRRPAFVPGKNLKRQDKIIIRGHAASVC